jgi:hypothetical protein
MDKTTRTMAENSSRKFLLGIVLMLSIAIAFVTFVKEILPTLGFPFIESVVIAVVCYAISIIILYKVVVWVEKI